ncbi:MAG: phytanoyl-CoA dioxygenase family protein [Planctomycetes bacterium]|nr:phytanoyl-CoA dioxygenase family protein [Planctomycetota bacterium]
MPAPSASIPWAAHPAADLAERYARDGYLLLEGVFSAGECAEMNAEARGILSEHGGPGSSIKVGASTVSALCRRWSDDERILAILRPLMPDGIMFLSDRIAFKSGRMSYPTPWHIDVLYWPNTRPKISVWIALDDVAAADGALQVVDGSHREDWTAHHVVTPGVNVGEFPMHVATRQWPAERETTCDVRRGSIIVFGDRLLHGTVRNTSGRDRYTLISTYHAPAPDDSFDVDFPARHVCWSPPRG